MAVPNNGNIKRLGIKCMLLVLAILSRYVATAQNEVYVSVSGNDASSGTAQAPFATLQKARDVIRQFRKKGTTVAGKPLVVWIKGGNYHLPEGFELTAADAGTAEQPVSFRAFNNEKVKLFSGIKVPAQAWKPLGRDAAGRVHPSVNEGALMELDVKAMGLKHAKQFAPGNSFSDNWFIIDLFANNKRQPLSQWPNPSENIRGINDPGWTTCNGSKDESAFYYGGGGNPQDKDTANEMERDRSGRAQRWAAALASGHELWLKGFWRVPWDPLTHKISEINTAEGWIRFAETPDRGMGSKYSAIVSESPLWRTGNGKEKWMALNCLEEIDMPGEWALDTKEGKVYYYLPAPADQLDICIEDNEKPIISAVNTAYISFIGLTVQGGIGNGISLKGSHHMTVAGCTIANAGNVGLSVRYGNHNLLQSNTIYEAAGTGIECAYQGDRKTLLASGTVLQNNYIHHTGKLLSREAIQLKSSVGITVAHTLLHDLPKSAVRTDEINNCIFEYNEVHNIALRESDNGAFYNYGGWSTYGNLFQYNFVHHVNRSNGFYCDDGDSGDRFRFNIVHDAIDAIKFGGGHDNIAEHNIFLETKNQVVDDRGISRNYRLGTSYETKLLQMKPLQEPWASYGKQLTSEYGLKHMLWTAVLDSNWHPEYPNGCAIRNNIAVKAGPFTKPAKGEVEISGNSTMPAIQEAGFADYQGMNLKTDHKLILKVFPSLNKVFPLIGLIKDEYRTTIPGRKETGGLVNRAKAGDSWNEDQFVD